jgi:hypothetical protein
MLPIVSQDMQFAILLVSFISGMCALLTSTFLLMLVRELTLLDQLQGRERRALLRRGYYLVLASFSFAIFHATRIVVVVQTNTDFSSYQWLLYDLCVGLYLFIGSSYIFSLFRALKPPTD